MDGQLYVDEYNSRCVVGDEDRPLRTRRVPTQSRRQRQNRESRLVVIAVTAMTLLTALVIAAWKFGDTTEPRVQGVNVPAASAGGGIGQVISITAARGASFMEVRAASGAGKPLYRGTLERGQVKRFSPQKLTIMVTSPKNVVVRVAGVRVKVPQSGQLTLPRTS
jgi:hypothetical protein